MRHKRASLDGVQIEKLITSNMTLNDIADYYKTSVSHISEEATKVFKKKKINKPIERTGCWMKSEERKIIKVIYKDSWLELKQTNLYKKLVDGGKNTL